MSGRQVVRIDTIQVTAGALPDPAAVHSSLPRAIRRQLDRPDPSPSGAIDQVASQVAMAVRSAVATESIER